MLQSPDDGYEIKIVASSVIGLLISLLNGWSLSNEELVKWGLLTVRWFAM